MYVYVIGHNYLAYKIIYANEIILYYQLLRKEPSCSCAHDVTKDNPDRNVHSIGVYNRYY